MNLEIKNGCFGYTPNHTILKEISFQLDQGKILTILGQNGTGKTTLLKCMMGLLKWQQGQTLIDGVAFSTIREAEGIGFVPQAHKTVFPFTVSELTAMGRARKVPIFGTPSKTDKEKVLQALETVGIAHLKDQLCSQLSGGQLQLVYIARALANDPELLIMDEPESHLDFKNQVLILKLVQKLKEEKGISCIINTHYPEHALKISDDTLMLGRGTYVYGSSDEIISEENIKRFFEVNAKIFSVPELPKNTKAFAVID